MALVPAKCTQCGGTIEVDDTKEAGICTHCGTAFITEKAINNYTTNYNITNNITKIINGKEVDDAEEEFNKGLVHLKTKKYDQARRCFDKAIRKSPEISKNYFYWCLAESENFKKPEVFAGQVGMYYLSEDKEDSHDMESFFALTNKEECEKLSNEFGIDLNNGFEGLVLSIFNKYSDKLAEKHDFVFFIKKVLDKFKTNEEIRNVVLEACKKYAIKQVKPIYEHVVRAGNADCILKSTRDGITEIINYLIENNAHPNYQGGPVYHLEAIELAAMLDPVFYAQMKNTENTLVQAKNNEKFERVKQNFVGYAALTILAIVVGVFLILYFWKAYSIYNSPDYVKGVTDIVKAPFKNAALISLAAGAITSIAAFIIYKIMGSKKK